MADSAPSARGNDPGFQGEQRARGDRDERGSARAPSAGQRSAAAAEDATVRWNRLGTPRSVLATTALATGLGKDPEAAAHAYVTSERALLGLDAEGVAALETIAVTPIGAGSVVTFRQRFGELAAGVDGLLTVGVRDGAVWSVSSSLSRDTGPTAAATLSEDDATAAAARESGLGEDAVVERVRLVAVPTPAETRAAYEVVLRSSRGDAGYTTWIDARTGDLLVQEDLVDHDVDNPTWEVFPANPPASYASVDNRETWCWTTTAGCERAVGNDESLFPWDVLPATGTSSFTTLGNNARTFEKWFSNVGFQPGIEPATPRPDRNYVYPWTNAWYEAGCNPSVLVPGGNDLDAARANLFAMHNRMHDFSYALGFTPGTWNAQEENGPGAPGAELDPEVGNAQAGAVVGGPPGFQSRDNANQFTPPDGITPISNMYLWQPIAGAFYSPCVDGDYDMTVIGHEYTHMITNRMIAGPNAGLSGAQAGAMGESWSDLLAMEYLAESGDRPAGRTPYVTGAYVTGDRVAGIRNYDMSRSPLNYSDVGYDITGPQVHADGEIWSATNFAVRRAFLERYGNGTRAQQTACLAGERPATQCPGNRRWAQLVVDSLLIPATGAVSMLDMRDAMLAADRLRFGAANQDILWDAFASRGMGLGASSAGTADGDPVPSFVSPYADNGTATFVARGDADDEPVRIYVGRYEARATPVADTDPATPLDASVDMVAGKYEGLAVGPTVGHARFTFEVRAGREREARFEIQPNLAAAANGATAAGDGVNLDALIDGTEATNWASLGAPVAGRSVTVDLAGERAERVRRVQVSALLRPGLAAPNPDPGGQSRFSALRRFAIETCDDTRDDCARESSWERVLTSPSDAFPSRLPRPRATDLQLGSWEIDESSRATHVRLVVLTNQCTGSPEYSVDSENDPRHDSACPTGNPAVAQQVRAAELQVFSR